MSELVLIGGGDHARVVADAARQSSWTVAGYIDPRRRREMEAMNIPWLGDDAAASAGPGAKERSYIVAVGGIVDTKTRRRIAEQYGLLGVAWATVIHDRAIVSARSNMGYGVAIFAGSIVNPDAVVAEHCIVNTGAVIEHDVRVEPFAHIGPGAVVGGGATIGSGAHVGLGARVRDHVRVGAGAIVGMGAVVVRDVADGAVVVGVPAAPLRRHD